MVNLVDRELKFFFTSPLFMFLELAPVALVAYIMLYSNSGLEFLQPLVTLLPAAWVTIVLYSAFFELEVWCRDFLNRGVKLKLYVNKSEYTPFLAHSLVSLVLLELKTLIVLTSLLAGVSSFNDLTHFLLATHGYWLFSLSFGYVFSKDVLRKIAGCTAVFLCVFILSAMISLFLIIQGQGQTQGQSSFLAEFYVGQRSLLILVVLLVSLLLYISALFACSAAARNVRIDDI